MKQCHWCNTQLNTVTQYIAGHVVLTYCCPYAREHSNAANRCNLCGVTRVIREVERNGRYDSVVYCGNMNCPSMN